MKKGAKWQQHSWTIVRLVSYLSSHWYKGGGAEAKYDLSTESHPHGWGPKLAARYFTLNLNNASKFYCFFARSTILQRLKCHWKSAYIIWLTHYFNKMMIWEREALELHQVLQILSQPLLVLTGRSLIRCGLGAILFPNSRSSACQYSLFFF